MKEPNPNEPGLYYDRQGREIDMMKWATLVGDTEYKRVRQTTVGDICISTVWLGLNHSLGGPPMIFESMIFGDPYDTLCWRYPAESLAILGHQRLVEAVRGKENLNEFLGGLF